MSAAMELRWLTLDAGALIAIDRRDRRVWATLGLARWAQWVILVPAGALGQVWRNPATQAQLAWFLKWRNVRVEPLTEGVAKAAGLLCGLRGTADLVDASVALCAWNHGGRVITSDPADLLHLIPSLHVVGIT
ncbi:MAG: PIN domain nuclease [Chloroflexi bacterium]|nr:PIN domain nuclease [Chloroflexota bacterium]